MTIPGMAPVPAKFHLGTLVATRAIALECKPDQIGALIARHVAGDWGTLDPEDQLFNQRELIDGYRVMSSYTLEDDSTVWIITENLHPEEGTETITTVLRPDDY